MKVSADYIELKREPFDSFQLCFSALMCTTVTHFCRWDKEFEVRGAGSHALSQEEICLMLRMKWDKLAGVPTDVCSGLTEQSV